MGLLDELFGGSTASLGGGVNLNDPLIMEEMRKRALEQLTATDVMGRKAPLAGHAVPDLIERMQAQPQATPQPAPQAASAPAPMPAQQRQAASVSRPSAPEQAAPYQHQRGFTDILADVGQALQGHDPRAHQRTMQAENMTANALMKHMGLDRETAMAAARNPRIIQMLPQLFNRGDNSMAVGPGQVIIDKRTGKPIFDNSENAKPMPGWRRGPNGLEYEPGGPADPEYHRQLELAKGGGGKLPTGHQWVDPSDHSKGVVRLPGFEDKIPGEVAGKVAMMSDARKRIKGTRHVFERDWGNGDIAQWTAANTPGVGDIAMLSGDVGIAQRDIRTGIEAALRTMTGAAAPEQEVKRYMQMYMPGPKDTKESAKQKIDGLINFMDEAEKLVMQGRGITPSSSAGQGGSGGAPDKDTALNEARWAIRNGADPTAVKARLKQLGYSLSLDGK